MSTTNHTPIAPGAGGNAATVNSPLGQLDAAIGNLATLTTSVITSVVGAINSLVTRINVAHNTDGTLKNGAVATTAVLADSTVATAKIADSAVSNVKLANDVKVGSLALFLTAAKTSVQAAVNEIVSSLQALGVWPTVGDTITTTFNADGSITETHTTGLTIVTTFNTNGTITQVYSGTISRTRTITFAADGTISEVIS